MDCLVSKYSYWHEEFNKSMVVIHQWLLQRYQTSKDSNLTFVDQKSQNYVIFMKSVWKRCKSNLNNNKNVNIPSRQCGQKKKCHLDIITEDPGDYFNEISVIRAFQRHHITLLVSKVEVILISAGSAYATFGTRIPGFRANSGCLLGTQIGKNDGFTKMSVESWKSYIV